MEEKILSFVTISGCLSISLDVVVIPELRNRGQNASLLCRYNLEEDEKLFSLKWYKDDEEFYRYSPPADAEPVDFSNQNSHHRKKNKWAATSANTQGGRYRPGGGGRKRQNRQQLDHQQPRSHRQDQKSFKT